MESKLYFKVEHVYENVIFLTIASPEDLDFTMIQLITIVDLGNWITQIADWITDRQGQNFSFNLLV